MSSRPPVRTAFQNLRPTILRQPARSVVSAEAVARLLDSPNADTISAAEPEQGTGTILREVEASITLPEEADSTGRTLLRKKKKDILIPVTFRMPQSLKEKLEQTARLYEVNQTDLINEAIEINLRRYV